jgi:uncharacterized protein (TIGR02996 family)
MNTDEEFLKLIRADLDNPAPRLVYADWLDEQGDPQGEFIRVQCELERPGLSALKQRQLRERERELLDEHEARWLEPVASMKLKTAEWKFRRGFVEEVTIDAGEFIERGYLIHRAFPLLCGLNLRNAEDRHVEPLAGCPALERTTRLHLTSDFGQVPLGAFAWDDIEAFTAPRIQQFLRSPYLAKLRCLSLADSSFRDEDLREFLACGNLRLHALDLSNNELRTRDRLGLDTFRLLAAASCTNELRELSLRSTGIGIDHVLILTYSRNLANLESLDLAGNRLGSQNQVLSLVGLKRLSKLKHLNLASCGIGDWGFRMLMHSAVWGHIETLQLWNNEIMDRGLIGMAEGDPPARLRSLELQRNQIGDAGLTALAGSKVLGAFRELHLEYNRIEDTGAVALAGSGYAGNLRELHLRGNAFLGDKGGIALASAGFPALDVLNLAGTEVGDACATAIAASPASASLRLLDLGRTRITETGALALAEGQFLDSLEFVDLRMNHLSGNCVTALKARFGHRVLV